MNREEGGVPRGLTERFRTVPSTQGRPLSYHLRGEVWGQSAAVGSEPCSSGGQVSMRTVSVFGLPCDYDPSRWGDFHP